MSEPYCHYCFRGFPFSESNADMHLMPMAVKRLQPCRKTESYALFRAQMDQLEVLQEQASADGLPLPKQLA